MEYTAAPFKKTNTRPHQTAAMDHIESGTTSESPASSEPRPPRAVTIGTFRIETLADGIFAISMTLLVLELILPKPTSAEEKTKLLSALVSNWPKFAAFFLSFLTCGVFWIGHIGLLHFANHSNRLLLWLNILYLMLVSAVPFSTALLGDYHPEPLALAVYCGNLFLLSTLQYALLIGIIREDISREVPNYASFHTMARNRLRVGPVLYLLAMVLCWFAPSLAMLICWGTLIHYMIPGRVDRFLRR